MPAKILPAANQAPHKIEGLQAIGVEFSLQIYGAQWIRVVESLTKTVLATTSKARLTVTFCKFFIIIPDACGIIVTIGMLTQIYRSNKRMMQVCVSTRGNIHCLWHRVETYRAVTDRRKHCGSLRFHVPTFFQATRQKMINCACSASLK